MDFVYLYTSADGRINRQPWWIGSLLLLLFNWLASTLIWWVFAPAVGMIDIEGPDATMSMMTMQALGPFMGIFYFLVSGATLFASIMLSIKRCHDRDKSGWWVLLLFVPMIGFIWALIDLGILAGTDGPNRFGPDPLAERT